jgi:site-specific DNA recombinase
VHVAVYLRISKDHTGDGLGVERQREDCLRYVAAKPGWEIVHIYTDNDVSATKQSRPRPQFERMLKAVEAGEVEVIVAKHLDRLLRRLGELERVFTICEAAGASIVTVSDGVDTSSDGGRLVARILASVAQGEVERKSARQKRAMRQRAESGKHWGGRAFGYSHDSLKVITKEANAIRRAYSSILAGETLHSIAADWNRRGLRTTKSGHRTIMEGENIEGGMWRGATVKLVLINPRYAGLRAHHGEIVGKAEWPAIISEEIWESVHSILTHPARQVHTAPDRSRKYLLCAILTCGVCGRKLRASGSGKKVKLYSCKHIGCYKVGRSMKHIDAIVTDLVKARLSQPDAADLFVPPETNLRHLYDDLTARRKKLEQIAIDYAEDVLTREQARAATAIVQARVDELEREIARSSQLDNDFTDFDPSKDVGEWFDHLPLPRKRALITMLFSKIAIHPVGKGWRGGAGFHGVDIEWRVDDDSRFGDLPAG